MTENVANPLTLVMTIKSQQDYEKLNEVLMELQGKSPDQNPITAALNSLSSVHFARFVFLNDRQLAVITEYDGSFEKYIDAFVNKIGAVFDLLLKHMQDAPPLPVETNRDAFLQYVQKNDLKCVGTMYSAYPNLTVMDILTMEKKQGNA